MTLTPELMATDADVEKSVVERYDAGAQAVETALCCPVDYDPRFLTVIPQEVLDRDYGCGDPSTHLRQGETVLDLGSGGGKIAFIASQVVGATGRVIGVDLTDEMLELARGAAPQVAAAVGYDNVEFRKGKIQDMRLDVAATEAWLAAHPITDVTGLTAYDAFVQQQKTANPLVADGSVDVVVSNCVLNLVAHDQKPALFDEIFRVLRRGGRAVISDIVSDVEVPEHLRADPDLWSGCISGAYQEEAFLQAFEDAGFYGVTLDKRDSAPWQVVQGIEFRSVTVLAYKGKQGPCLDHGQAVVFRAPGNRSWTTTRTSTNGASPPPSAPRPSPCCPEPRTAGSSSSSSRPRPSTRLPRPSSTAPHPLRLARSPSARRRDGQWPGCRQRAPTPAPAAVSGHQQGLTLAISAACAAMPASRSARMPRVLGRSR